MPLSFLKYFFCFPYVLAGTANFGYCPICEKKTIFIEKAEWLRDHYKCLHCNSIPRNRALIYFLQKYFPEYRGKKIHESSPGGPASQKLQQECKYYTPTHYFADIPVGSYKKGIRCENLECMTFMDEAFDLVITQDVMEHVLNPGKAYAEIARTLKPGGAHVFTVPLYRGKKTLVRAVETPDGIRYLQEKQFHGNPIDKKGSLVVTEWGDDLIDYIYQHSGLITTAYNIKDRKLGIDGEFLEVFLSRKVSS